MKNLINIIESILFVSGKEVAVKDISEKLEVSEKEIKTAVEELKLKYSNECGLYLLTFNNKLQFSSNPIYAESVSNVLNPIREKEFTKTILEVCAIIAYRQPITKTEIEFIKGVKSCDYAIQTLLSLNIIEPVGRKDAIGRPILYATTDNFLKRFDLESLDALPDYEMLIDKIKELRTDTSDEYLFKKDEYNEELAITENPKGNPTKNEKKKAKAETDEEEEELPDFLKDEDVVSIG